MKRKHNIWKLKDREIQLGDRTLIMGVINVTPDSFSDGGRFLDPDRAYARALEMEDEGADIIDIGAESTRPDSKRISEEEELRRLVPVLKRLRGKLATPISVDTYKSAVADKALELGAEIINDASALTFDPQLAKVVLKHDAGLILNHMRGTPESWDSLPPLPDVMGTIYRDLEASVRRAQLAGLDNSRIVVDPGIGFGKRGDQNYDILARLFELAGMGLPILAGPSRKRFLEQTTEEGLLAGTAAAVTTAILAGAHIVRVHDVKEMIAAARVADEVLKASERKQRAAAAPKTEPRRPPVGHDRCEGPKPAYRGQQDEKSDRPPFRRDQDRPERGQQGERSGRPPFRRDQNRPERGQEGETSGRPPFRRDQDRPERRPFRGGRGPQGGPRRPPSRRDGDGQRGPSRGPRPPRKPPSE